MSEEEHQPLIQPTDQYQQQQQQKQLAPTESRNSSKRDNDVFMTPLLVRPNDPSNTAPQLQQHQQSQLPPPSPRFGSGGRKHHSRQSSAASTEYTSDKSSGTTTNAAAVNAAVNSYYALTRTPSTAGSTKSSSRAPSPGNVSDMSDDLPTNVSTPEQLLQLPEECISVQNPDRPLQHFGEDGVVSTYALRPMLYSVIFILIVELFERFAFYGINYTQTSYLTGEYDEDWNAGMESVPASSYVSISVAVAYTTPFLGAYFADTLFGDYYSIIVGSICFYLPGLFLIALTTIPGLLGEQFNNTALAAGLLFLWPVGTGIVKSVVNVFGAKQFHPLLQSSLIEAYYVNFYMCINVGALIGGVAVPVLAQHNVTIAYFLPVSILTFGIVMFLLGSPRYVITKPKVDICSVLSFHKHQQRKKNTKSIPKTIQLNYTRSNNDDIPLSSIARVSLLIVPFCIAYSQMATTFIIQGNVMEKAFGWIDAATMNNADAVAVLIFGYVIGSGIYPFLNSRGIKIPTTYKFAIGSGLGALAIAWALLVDALIHTRYNTNGTKISILWQAMSYVLIGIGEIFAVSAAYEVAFTASPPEKKVLSSAVNLFCIGGLPNVICIVLYQACTPWFTNEHGTTHITHIGDYASAHVDKYFWLLFIISVFGVVINLLPSVREYVETIEERATDIIRTPKTPIRPPRREPISEEEQDLLAVKRHQYYLKYGSGPSLYKSGSMRAGPSMKRVSAKDVNDAAKKLKKHVISKLYMSDAVLPPSSTGGTSVVSGNTSRLYKSESLGAAVGATSAATASVLLSASGKPVLASYMPISITSPTSNNKKTQHMSRDEDPVL